MLRYYEQQSNVSHIVCTDEDFGNALWMIEYSMKWSLGLFKSLPGEKMEAAKADRKTHFMQKLPVSFGRDEIKALAKELGLPERTVSRYLKEFVDSRLLIRIQPGVYKKTAMAAMALAAPDINENDN